MDEYLPASPTNFSLHSASKSAPKPKLPIKDWPHAPVHRLCEHGIYMMTASTLYKARLFDGHDKLGLLETALLNLSKQCGWQLEAWAVLANHYHFVARGAAHSVHMSEFL